MSDDIIFSRVKTLLDKLRENQKLQELAEKNGLDVKNSLKLTSDTIDNIAVSKIALLLAKRSGDPRYIKLVHTGTQKRSLETDIVNTYKSQANQLIAQYKNNMSNEE